ncbi:MAG: c-type cytochrome [Candidatus Tectomicrobia bacterium]|uniref:C-type cytochrome n=1 Tax=Tectimicrobiota bacterium TaxID=2528274 RepID=A0A933GMU3_UNCTE|nr:c-type cytochrome [Candidatus Tectomicrobia bacterium]
MSSKIKIIFVLCMSFIWLVLMGEISTAKKMDTAPNNIPGTIKATSERLLRGKAIYSYYCSPCHGPEGTGLGPNAGNLATRPRNFTDKLYMDTKSDRDLFQVIKGGGSMVGLSFLMPPWGGTLLEQELFDIIVYLRTFEAAGK